MEEVDEKMALKVLYEGAIYRHASDTYRVSYSILYISGFARYLVSMTCLILSCLPGTDVGTFRYAICYDLIVT